MHPCIRRPKVTFVQEGIFLMVAFSFFSLFILDDSDAKTRPKELPVLVTVKELLTDQAQYDGHRVAVTGRIHSIMRRQGRRGGPFFIIVLGEESPEANGPVLSVEVITLNLPKVRQGHIALVQGVYRREGRQAGRPFHNFIDAEVILKEKS
ncbi:MAG: hypothetical protein ACE5J1_00500 [Nitrospiria bacterium]